MPTHTSKGLYKRDLAQFAWMKQPWACPNCGKQMTSGGKGPHLTWCGKEDELLWARIDKKGPDECWTYKGACDRRGYGRPGSGTVRLANGKYTTYRYYAHRRVYEMLVGPIPGNLQVCHHCDNPPCCNPKHLFTGTNNDNTLDMLRKERHRRKLSAAQVREIIPLKGIEKADDVGLRYDVCGGTIGAIWAGRSWRHLQPPEVQEAMKGYRKKKRIERPPLPKGPRPHVIS